MMEQLIEQITASGWRLVSLTDMSVAGQARWWATLHRLTNDGVDTKFGEGKSACDALSKAIEAEVRSNRWVAATPPAGPVESAEDGEGLDF